MSQGYPPPRPRHGRLFGHLEATSLDGTAAGVGGGPPGHANLSRGPGTRPIGDALGLKRRLSIPRVLIFDSSVDGGTPSRAAAPKGPATRPLLFASAASMASFLWAVRVLVGRLATGGVPRDRAESHRGSTESVSESHTITARSITF